MGERIEPPDNPRDSQERTQSDDGHNSDTFAPHKKRCVHYGDPDYFDQLPRGLKFLEVFEETGIPFAKGSFGLYTLSYEVDIDANTTSLDEETE